MNAIEHGLLSLTRSLSFSVKGTDHLTDHRDGPLTIYVLFEHKSSPEYWTALQLLRYLVAEGDAYRKQHPKARLLPPVYPLVIYHGNRHWQAPAYFNDLIAPLPVSLLPLA